MTTDELPTRLQLETLVPEKEKSEAINLLGPYRLLTKICGIDCSAVEKYNNGSGNKLISHLVQGFTIAILVVYIYRGIHLLSSEANVLTFQWAESNFFGFTALHAVVCAFCLYGWTKNGFISSYLKNLNAVRLLRNSPNPEIDDYSKFHRKSLALSLIWFVAFIGYAIHATYYQKILYGGTEVEYFKCGIMLVLSVFAWLTVTLVLAYYNIVGWSMARELAFFNKELQNASDERLLSNPETISGFSHRQVELLKLVKKSNESLRSYARVAPLFSFFVVINGIYLTFFFSGFPPHLTILMVGNLMCSFGILINTFVPASAVQKQIKATSGILLVDDEVERSNIAEVFQAYKTMINRSLNYDTRIRVMNGFPIDTANFNMAMLIVPNIGAVLIIVKKIMDANGLKL